MKPKSIVTDLVQSLYHALNVELSDMIIETRDLKEFHKLPKEEQQEIIKSGSYPMKTYNARPTEGDCDVQMFVELWSSTALGFGGIGGAAMTYAYTVIIKCEATQESLVYWNGKFAYKIDMKNKNVYDLFLEDVKQKKTRSKRDASIKYGIDL